MPTPQPEKFQRCPHCQNFIPEVASICMYCGRDVDGQGVAAPRKKKKGTKFSDILVYTVAIIVLLAIISNIPYRNSTDDAPQSTRAALATFTPTMDAAGTPVVEQVAPSPAPVSPPADRSVFLTMSAYLDGQTLSIQGETDLPDGALIAYEYTHERLLLETETYWGDGSATVQGGRYAVQADLSGWPPGEVEVWASFWTIGQPAEIVATFGELGEKLVGENVSVSKDGTVRRIEMIETVVIPDVVHTDDPVANGDANLRAGPGTEYAVVGGVATGSPLQVVARNEAGDWVRLADGNWMAGFLVDGLPGDLPVAVVEAPPAVIAPAAVAPTTPPAFIVQPTPLPQQAAVCNCSGDVYNCSSFPTHASAQACFRYCLSVGAGDIHGLDRDNDGIVCESRP